jgi:hypothetical protein
VKRNKPLRSKKSLRQLTEEKNRARLAAGEPLPNLSRLTPLPARTKKPKRSRREVDPDFLAFVRQQPCAVLYCPGHSQAHHLKTKGSGGSDYTAVPLCAVHHTFDPGVHALGLTTFEARYNVDLWAVNAAMLEQYERMTDNNSQTE